MSNSCLQACSILPYDSIAGVSGLSEDLRRILQSRFEANPEKGKSEVSSWIKDAKKALGRLEGHWVALVGNGFSDLTNWASFTAIIVNRLKRVEEDIKSSAIVWCCVAFNIGFIEALLRSIKSKVESRGIHCADAFQYETGLATVITAVASAWNLSVA